MFKTYTLLEHKIFRHIGDKLQFVIYTESKPSADCEQKSRTK
jgi:hypothetical protein